MHKNDDSFNFLSICQNRNSIISWNKDLPIVRINQFVIIDTDDISVVSAISYNVHNGVFLFYFLRYQSIVPKQTLCGQISETRTQFSIVYNEGNYTKLY